MENIKFGHENLLQCVSNILIFLINVANKTNSIVANSIKLTVKYLIANVRCPKLNKVSLE